MTKIVFRAASSAVLAALLVSCTPQDQTSQSDPSPAPDYRAVSLEGDSVSLQQQKGQVVLLNIWATWCEPCREEMPYLQKVFTKNSAAGLKIIGVSIDARGEEQRIRSFLSQHGATFPIWLDPDDRASFLFRAIGVPASYLITRDGRVVWKKLGAIKETDTSFANALSLALAKKQ